MSTPTACSCTPAIKIEATGRYILPQTLAVAPQQLATRLPFGTYSSVYFGRNGVSIDAIMAARNDMAVLAHNIPGGYEKPLKSSRGRDKTTMELRVHWPDHDYHTQAADNLPFSAATAGSFNRAQIAGSVGRVVADAMSRCCQYRPREHCCWAVGTDDTHSVTWRCVYLMAIHHIGGVTYQPELHVDMSLKPPLFRVPALSQTTQQARLAGMIAPTCYCTRTDKDEKSGMYVLPQRVAVVRKTVLAQWPVRTFPSVVFGRSKPLPILMLDANSADVLQEKVPNALETPFEEYYSEQFTNIKIKVYWPDHDFHTDTTEVVSLMAQGRHITKAQLAKEVARTVRLATNDHCCWAVLPKDDDTDFANILHRTYLVALHHIGGVSFQPEIHIAPRATQNL
ncbi:hypothetical protein EVJ58_g7202 [Rhodofomes roseus]|uniref:Uncharacterized protein n=1 Tax=Rhodofomes roseus TaxID=34475 RepID=A0A4Y9Y3T5_9APHY|nr:hypothetical protein EVJ58_g7202 [Rhodofomes roseus]